MQSSDIVKLEEEDAKLRFEVSSFAIDYVADNQAKLCVHLLSEHELNVFVNEFRVASGSDSKKANKLLTQKRYEDLIACYDPERLYALWQFSEYCGWIEPDEIVRHFGRECLSVFYALEGNSPAWLKGEVSYIYVLRAVWLKLMNDYRNGVIDEYLNEHYEDVNKFFTDNSASPVNVIPEDKKGIVQMFHVYSRLRRKWSEDEKQARKWMREHPEEVNRVREKYSKELGL